MVRSIRQVKESTHLSSVGIQNRNLHRVHPPVLEPTTRDKYHLFSITPRQAMLWDCPTKMHSLLHLHLILQYWLRAVRRVLTTRRIILWTRTQKETVDFKTRIIKRLQQIVKLGILEPFLKNSDTLEMIWPMFSVLLGTHPVRVPSSKPQASSRFKCQLRTPVSSPRPRP